MIGGDGKWAQEEGRESVQWREEEIRALKKKGREKWGQGHSKRRIKMTNKEREEIQEERKKRQKKGKEDENDGG